MTRRFIPVFKWEPGGVGKTRFQWGCGYGYGSDGDGSGESYGSDGEGWGGGAGYGFNLAYEGSWCDRLFKEET